ncbi:antibiotic biosynthesis monooxygenase family protein [Sinorhizobium alkalisoli]|uniref:Antibiotic biosynthesis monooxygenase n=1 Tax=Sinorhizobium alkalisoli TaxID=1752398 RepID=A0A1E3V5W8_9HYPH|nr:antibiotic biosynthesis monooxygenase [Sinorhizobium alkalisoli]MCA1489628.1 antibiotic biosynthesis monooxygenase [Ensifer sp. NBAIM29]MCG5478350.1 antibiotic biosynthesis monooxygenase [Sinorhizobium alkalisoli]ODR89024.1 antibiotic biosynthesis monooxygenase [Sinorhizobium alkalisoli]QFI65421.1 Antibiotic biosynthesis monooxygenase [Sinorhizobium alkalisoli]
MIAVIFEVLPADGKRDTYLGLAADLRPLLEGIEGFISIERFQSLAHPNRLLSLSFWRDEAAVKAWRNSAEHRAAQEAGRRGVFADYRLRIASVVRDYGLKERDEVPPDSQQWHEKTETGRS